MKIMIVSDAWKPQVNGVVRTYEHIIEELEKAGHEIKVIGPVDFPFCIPLPGYAEIRLALAPYARLARMIDAFDPDAIHIGTEGSLGHAARRYCRKRGFKFTTCYHSHFPDYIAARVRKFIPFLEKPVRHVTIKALRLFHGAASAMMVATQSLEEELKSWGFEGTLMQRLSRGVHLERFFPGEKELFTDLPRPVALYVGRVAIEKNLEDFLHMRWDGSKVVVGDGPALAALRRKYPAVHFLGKKEGDVLGAHYRSADIFVFPSRTDTFGMVLVEALASGLPIAAYDVTGPRDIVTTPHLGALHECDLADAAQRALAQTGEQAAKARRAHVEAHYTWPAVAQRFLDIVESVGK